ncbi:flagellar filament capping protein FliD [Nocardioides yefusunii]|uniref:Flagellar hook-associated protein 2 n=1 Tax=Nocardioides yefusunii TaxID=2500546 RepID=A0ABW1QYS6_9ACTN|nr:flagellar filament capping protein FliD [Nocardioides yefusunii]
MATSTISGLSSGIDTATIVDQLMQIEAVSQKKLQTQVNKRTEVVTALRSINTTTVSLSAQAKDLVNPTTWAALSTTSSLPGVTVSATTDAMPGSFALTVNQVATRHGETYTNTAALTDVLVPADADGKRLLTVARPNGDTVSIDTGDGTLKGITAALNDPANNSGVTATMLQVSAGNYRLVVDSAATGTGNEFTLATADGGALLGGAEATRTRVGKDAEIEISGLTLTSTTNSFDEIMPGVSVTLASTTELGKSSNVEISRNATERSAAVKAVVDSINFLSSTIATRISYDSSTGVAGVLSGDSTVRALRNAFADTLYSTTGGTNLTDIGLQVDRYGKLIFDEAAFAKAYEENPARVAEAFGTGADSFATRVSKLATQYSDPYDGILAGAINGHQATINELNKSIEAWDLRLEVRRTTLTRMYTAMETSLARLQGQGDYISGQISSWNASKN